MSAEVFDRVGAFDRVENDLELLRELFGIFFGEYADARGKLDAALAQGNTKELHERAHALKSALGNIGAARAHQAAYALERAGRENRIAECPALLAALYAEIEQFKVAIKDV